MSKAVSGNAGVWSNLGIVLWAVYGVLAEEGQLLRAGLICFALAAGIIAMQYRRGAVKTMDCTSLVYFGGVVLVVLAGGARFITHYHLLMVWGIFAAVAWATLILGFPFTLQYARERAPHEVWETPVFQHMNVRMTQVWAIIFTACATLGAISLDVGHTLMLGLIVPGIAMMFGFIFSRRYPKRFAAQFAAEIGGKTTTLSSRAEHVCLSEAARRL
ncbi:MAG TPA: hypothetical protein VKS22_05245 [Candidatus Binataceae bacterium]|nr:hypothetical protein [Candidatus Binataceae bacterium]